MPHFEELNVKTRDRKSPRVSVSTIKLNYRKCGNNNCVWQKKQLSKYFMPIELFLEI